jgi:hypothetical protein
MQVFDPVFQEIGTHIIHDLGDNVGIQYFHARVPGAEFVSQEWCLQTAQALYAQARAHPAYATANDIERVQGLKDKYGAEIRLPMLTQIVQTAANVQAAAATQQATAMLQPGGTMYQAVTQMQSQNRQNPFAPQPLPQPQPFPLPQPQPQLPLPQPQHQHQLQQPPGPRTTLTENEMLREYGEDVADFARKDLQDMHQWVDGTRGTQLNKDDLIRALHKMTGGVVAHIIESPGRTGPAIQQLRTVFIDRVVPLPPRRDDLVAACIQYLQNPVRPRN